MELCVILVEPEIEENIGSVCRCIKNFGFEKLILINPPPLSQKAYTMAMHAKDILDRAIIFDDLKDALLEVQIAVATTAVRGSDKNLKRVALTPQELSKNIAGKVGIVFGRESIGLKNSEIELCDFCVSIPTHEKYETLNLSHAVCILLYELFKVSEKEERWRSASREERELIISDFEKILAKLERREFKKGTALGIFKRVLARSFLTGREAHTLKGIFRKIKEKL
ncbi:MAG: RNA methyltransferase [Candidatus Methanofastidiosia archaeon]